MELALQSSLFEAADRRAPRRRRVGRGALRLADRRRRAVRRADGRHPVARRAQADVRPRARRAAAGQLPRSPSTNRLRTRGSSRCADGSTTPTPANSASRSPPQACACTATATTASPGTATPSAAAAPRTPWWPSSSLGATRVFALRPRGGGKSLRLHHRHGDLLVMGGSCQRTWEHAIPKTARPVGPRISIQFRPHDVR